MKKLIAVILAILMLACAALAEDVHPLAGGWTVAEDPAVTGEIKEVFDKAMEGMVGITYEPVAYLGSQLVAGMNYAILCRVTIDEPGAQPGWVVLYLYRDLEGNVVILDAPDFDIGSLRVYESDPGYAEDPHTYASFITADETRYDLFVITKMNYGPDHKVTSVTGHYERIVTDSDGIAMSDIAPGSEMTLTLAEDFTADMLNSMWDGDYALLPVTDLYEWYIDAYLGRDDYDGHEWVFTSDLTEAEYDTVHADFWFVTTKIELNEANEIRYMQYVYVPWG